MSNVIKVDFGNQQVVKNITNIVPKAYDPMTCSPEEFTNQIRGTLQNRFGENQNPGGVLYKAPKVKGGGLDTYGRGNFHNSVHQWKHPEPEWWNNPMPFPSNYEMLYSALEKAGRGSVFTVGHKSDAFQWLDAKYQVTKRLLVDANKLGIKLIFNTMSDLCAHDDYLELIVAGGHEIVMQMGVNDDRAERILSPGAPSRKRRTMAIEKMRAAGVKVTIITADINKFKRILKKQGFEF